MRYVCICGLCICGLFIERTFHARHVTNDADAHWSWLKNEKNSLGKRGME